MTFGLKEEIFQNIIHILEQCDAITEVVLYGSRAKGNFKPGSDIDLTFKGDTFSLQNLHEIDVALDDLLLPYSFDLSIYHHIDNPELLDHITRVGQSFYRREGLD